MKNTRKALGAIAVGLMGAGAMAACAPEAPAPVDPDPTGVTTTTDVTYACEGSGIIGPGGAQPVGPIADQVTDVAITLPSSAADGDTIDVTVDVGNLNLAAAPSFIDLNSAGIVATIHMTGVDADASVAANNFVGNGASIDLASAGTTATVATGTNTVTVGDIDILSGSTGFVCSPVGTAASASIDV